MVQRPYIVSIQHQSLEVMGEFANRRHLGDNLVAVLPIEGARSIWATYRVTGDQLTVLRADPDLVWK